MPVARGVPGSSQPGRCRPAADPPGPGRRSSHRAARSGYAAGGSGCSSGRGPAAGCVGAAGPVQSGAAAGAGAAGLFGQGGRSPWSATCAVVPVTGSLRSRLY